MQHFHEDISKISSNTPEAINSLPEKLGYEGPPAPKVDLDATLLVS